MVAIIIGGTLLYAARGAFSAVATFLITLLAALTTANYYTLLERVILKIHESTASYADALAFLLTFLISFLLLQYLAITFFEEHIALNIIANGLGGAIFGAFASTLLAGVLVIAWFMLPGSVYLRKAESAEPSVVANVDEHFLDTVRFIANDRIPGQAAFDPTHTFMRLHTNKYRLLQRSEIDNSSQRGRRR
ncbi:MAG: CvpA family protein [Planctomycetes bacterium]|nr:CvpA family protein [Planctomycetota bacterium]